MTEEQSRRELLKTGSVGLASATVLAGCNSSSDESEPTDVGADGEQSGADPAEEGTESDDSASASFFETETAQADESPTATVEAFFEALGEGDVDAINAFIPEDAPLDQISQEDVSESTQLSLRRTKLVEKADERATVDVIFYPEEVDSQESTPAIVRLRRRDGSWHIWDIEPGSEELVPEAQFAFEQSGTTVEI